MVYIRPARLNDEVHWAETERVAKAEAATLVLQRELIRFDGESKDTGEPQPRFALLIAIGTKMKLLRLASKFSPVQVRGKDLDEVMLLKSRATRLAVGHAETGEFGRLVKAQIEWEQVGYVCDILNEDDRSDLEAKLHAIREVAKANAKVDAKAEASRDDGLDLD